MREFIEKIILGNIARGLDAGKYGAFPQKAFRFAKGYATWTGAALAMIFTFAAQVDATVACTMIAQVAAVLSSAGLVRKGAYMEPPQIPLAMRDALEAGASILTWLLLTVNGVIYLAQQLHSPWALGVSEHAQFVALVLTGVSGFIATYAAEPPASATPNDQANR
jgi:hypothetical protein